MTEYPSVTVPSIRVLHPAGDLRPHAQYEFLLRMPDRTTCSTWRRWSECSAFAASATVPSSPPSPYGGVSNGKPSFPAAMPSFLRSDLGGEFLESRRQKLQLYMSELLTVSPQAVVGFLAPVVKTPSFADDAVAVEPNCNFLGLDALILQQRSSSAEGDLLSPQTCGSDPRHSFAPMGRGSFGRAVLEFSPASRAASLDSPTFGAAATAEQRAAIHVQRSVRGHATRLQMRRAQQLWQACAARHVQRCLRGGLVRCRVRRAQQLWQACAARHVQRCLRGGLVRCRVRRVRQLWQACAARHVQRCLRGGLVRCRVRRVRQLWQACAARHVQRCMLGACARRRLRLQSQAATRIQACSRGRSASGMAQSAGRGLGLAVQTRRGTVTTATMAEARAAAAKPVLEERLEIDNESGMNNKSVTIAVPAGFKKVKIVCQYFE